MQSPVERAQELRDEALRECAAQLWKECVRDLDAAREGDPDGDRAPEVRRAREQAEQALHPLRR